MSIPFIDLKAQYQALKPQIQTRIDAVLEHGQYIMGPEVKELEGKLATLTRQRHRGFAHESYGAGHWPGR
jgi:UDP-2-acetamido-2-deoxy-ribo-hexuluronate aminotransferase